MVRDSTNFFIELERLKASVLQNSRAGPKLGLTLNSPTKSCRNQAQVSVSLNRDWVDFATGLSHGLRLTNSRL